MVRSQRHFDHLKHLHAPEFHLKGCVCQCDFRRISLRLMLYVPPMSLQKSARKWQIYWCARDIHKNTEHKEKLANPVISRVCELFGVVPVTGLEPVRCRQRWILSPLRLPIPSHRQVYQHIIPYRPVDCKKKFAPQGRRGRLCGAGGKNHSSARMRDSSSLYSSQHLIWG